MKRNIKNKKGQFTSLGLVLLTIIMMGATWILYAQQQENAENALISPTIILNLRDETELFNNKEEILAKETIKELCKKENIKDKETFKHEFRTQFLQKYPEEMKTFLQEDLEQTTTANIEFENYLYNNIYKRDNIQIQENNLTIQRTPLTKKILLKTKYPKRINYQTDLTYTFNKTQNINIPCKEKIQQKGGTTL